MLNRSQLRSAWVLEDESCRPPNIESNKLAIIVMLAADILLVLIMLLGLLRLRDRAGGIFGLARLLWKQVRWWPVLVVQVVNPLIHFSVRKGVILLLVAAKAGLTTVVSIAVIPTPLRSQTICTVGVRVLGSEPYVVLFDVSSKGVDFCSKFQFHSISYVPLYCQLWICSFLSSLQNIDVLGAHANHNNHHCNTDVHLSSRL
jgi:hypothetical protein